jgi:hypothetical protein
VCFLLYAFKSRCIDSVTKLFTVEAKFAALCFDLFIDQLAVLFLQGSAHKHEQEGDGPTPQEGDVLELDYVATVCSADDDGT